MNSFFRSSFLFSVLVAVALSLAMASTAYAEPRIAFVDIQKALAESNAGKRAKTDYEAEVKRAQSEIDKKKQSFQKKREAFEKQAKSLNQNARSEKQEELISMEKDLQRDFKDSEERLRRKNNVIVGELISKLRSVVKTVAEKQDYSLVFEKNSDAVIYASSQIDITPNVITAFNSSSK